MRASLVPLALTLGVGALGRAAFAEDDAKAPGATAGTWRRSARRATASTAASNGIPAILGWDADRFARTLEFYRTGERTNPVMVSVAKSLDAEQVRALAVYYASLPKPGK